MEHIPLSGLWQNPLQVFREAARRYGDVVALGRGSHCVFLRNHPDYSQDVLQDHHLNYRKDTRIERITPLFGTGLTTSVGCCSRPFSTDGSPPSPRS